MDVPTISLARNEIYVRHGRLFNDKEIQMYFKSHGILEDFDDEVFNQYEKANLKKIAVIKSYTAS